MKLESRPMPVGLWIAWILFGLLDLEGLPLSAQTYLFNKANFATGKTPVAVVTGDFNGDGYSDMAVANNGDNTLTVLINNGDGTFKPQTTFSTGTGPVAIAVGDFNGDGKLGLAVANQTDNTVSILLGNGDGTFTLRSSPPTGTSPVAVAVGDFNGDGKLDLAVVNQTDGTVSILLGNGDGTFTAKSPIAVGTSPAWVAVGDFNSDNNLDLAVVNQKDNTVSILLGDGKGGFTAESTPPATGASPAAVAVGDFDGDSNLDLAVVNSGGNTVSILLNNGTGTFGPKSDFATGSQPVAVTTGDFNGDKKLDLAVINQKDNTVSILLNSGTGTFPAHVDYSTGTAPAGVAAVDFTGSGILDLAVSNSADNTVSVLLGNGNGAFSTRADIATGKGPLSVVAADFNSDGKEDLAIANQSDNTLSIFLGNGDGTFTLKAPSPYATGTAPVAIAFGGFNNNNDSNLDLAVVNQVDGTVSIFLGNGDGTFTPKPPAPVVGTAPFSLTVGDFNGDGKQDLAVANSNCVTPPCAPGGTVSILLGNGDGTFTPKLPPITVGNRPLSVVAADFNGDSILDLAVANFNDNTVSVLLGNGDGTFTPATNSPFATGSGPSSIAVADFNGDRTLDLAIADFNTPGSVSILLGNGNGTFQTAKNFPVGGSPDAIFTADINGDGKLDLAVAKFGASAVAVLLGNGDGTFQAHADYATGTSPTSVALANFIFLHNEIDLAVANRDTNNLSVYLNLPILAFFPTSLNFVNQQVGTTSAIKTVTLSNPGSVPISITSIAVTGANVADFAESNNCGSGVASGKTCTISVSFTPLVSGPFNAMVTITDNVQGIPHQVMLSGNGGVPGAVLSRTSLNFGTVALGNSGVMTVTVTNNGTAPLTVSQSAITDPTDFAQHNNCGSPPVMPGTNCTITVTFSPQSAVAYNATLTITDNAPSGSQTVSLAGMGTGAGAVLSPASLTFPAQIVTTTSSPQTVMLKNAGNVSLNITSIKASGDFALVPSNNPCGTSLNMNASCTISVTFTPTAANTRTGVITIVDNAGNSPQTISLTGTGEDFSISATNASATVTAGGNATYTLSIAGESGFSQPVALTCAGAPALASCTVSPSSVTPSGSTASTATVTVTTTAPTSALPHPLSRIAPPPLRLGLGAHGLLGLLGLALMLTRFGTSGRKARRTWWRWAVVALTALAWAACGGGGSNFPTHSPGTTPGAYPLAVAGTYSAGSTTVQRFVKLTLKVN